MIKETINVIVRRKAILTFSVNVSLDPNTKMPTFTGTLVLVNGGNLVPSGKNTGRFWESLSSQSVLDLVQSSPLTMEEYNSALYCAELRAKENMVYIDPID